MNEVKVGKLPNIVSYTCNFISKLLQGGQKYGGFLHNCINIPLHCFVLDGPTVSVVPRFQNRVCSPHQEKERNMVANEEMGAAIVGSR